MKKIKCPTCRHTELGLVARAGRAMKHRLLTHVPIPDDFALPECGHCGAAPIDWQTAKKLHPVLEEAYGRELILRTDEALRRLKEAKPLREWEALLGLSSGYLSKVKSETRPSAQLAALLWLLANDPARADEIRDVWSVHWKELTWAGEVRQFQTQEPQAAPSKPVKVVRMDYREKIEARAA